ncbi:MAG: YhfC family intramembrane metalloprotease [Eubacteriaceae bacterium]|nr:YhfC family intramembrane metalloprotease [Eubacteriaceae bacterium]
MSKTILITAVIVFAFGLPTALTVWWKRKTGIGIAPFLVGAACFVLFAYVLESLCHSMVLMRNGSYTRFYTDPVLYTVYGCLAAGIFEETGRLFGFKVLLKKYDTRETAVAYGIGHGGIEAILVLGSSYVILLLTSLGVSLGDPAADVYYASVLGELTPFVMMLGSAERIIAMAIHVGLSMIVFTAARDKNRFALYPLAILLHALADVSAALYQQGIITSLYVTELLAALAAIAVFILGKRILYSSGIPSMGQKIIEEAKTQE